MQRRFDVIMKLLLQHVSAEWRQSLTTNFDNQISQHLWHGIEAVQDEKHTGVYAIELMELTDKVAKIPISCRGNFMGL